MAYVDGYVLPVPKKKLHAYRRMARKAGKIWREHGALQVRECVADDVKPGKVTSKVMKDKRLASMMDPKAMPFDGKRMFWGGFRTMVDL